MTVPHVLMVEETQAREGERRKKGRENGIHVRKRKHGR